MQWHDSVYFAMIGWHLLWFFTSFICTSTRYHCILYSLHTPLIIDRTFSGDAKSSCCRQNQDQLRRRNFSVWSSFLQDLKTDEDEGSNKVTADKVKQRSRWDKETRPRRIWFTGWPDWIPSMIYFLSPSFSDSKDQYFCQGNGLNLGVWTRDGRG